MAVAAAAMSLRLRDGSAHPQIGYGTYKVGFVPASASGAATASDRDPRAIIQDALGCGYRYFDCAEFYGNEAMVGQALTASGIARSELYLVSKCWTTTIYNGAEAVRQQVEKTLKDLQTDYLDGYLVHWPVPEKHIEAYKAMEALQKEGKLRTIGVSNYTIEDYEELKAQTTVPPVINQIEVNPFLYRKSTVDYFHTEGVRIEAYRALRNGKQLDNDKVSSIAAAHGVTVPQVMVKWGLQHELIVVAKSSNKERMQQNLDVAGFTLSPEQMAVLDSLTTAESLEEYRQLYIKCVVRDTPLNGTATGVKPSFTVG